MLAFRWDCLEQFSSKHFCGVIESGRSELWRGVTFSRTWKGLDIDPGKAVPDSMFWDREICTACWTNNRGTGWKTAREPLLWPQAWPFLGGAGQGRATDRQVPCETVLPWFLIFQAQPGLQGHASGGPVPKHRGWWAEQQRTWAPRSNGPGSGSAWPLTSAVTWKVALPFFVSPRITGLFKEMCFFVYMLYRVHRYFVHTHTHLSSPYLGLI